MSQPNTQTFGPYSPLRQAGNTYYVSGQVGVDPSTGRAAAATAAQTEQVFANLKAVLAQGGLSLSNVVKATIYLTDMSDFAAVNEVYVKYFEPPRPARAAVGVAELPRVGGDVPIKVEIEAIAMKGN